MVEQYVCIVYDYLCPVRGADLGANLHTVAATTTDNDCTITEHGTYIRWEFRNGCARVECSRLFDLFKALV